MNEQNDTTANLGKNDISDMLALQEAVLSTLKENQKHFIIPKKEEDLKRHFANNQKAIGIWVKGQLVAQAIIYADTKHMTRVGCVLVHPDFRKKGLSGKMIRAWLSQAAENGYKIAKTIVKIDNAPSLGSFSKHGFKMATKGKSPDDGNDVFFLYKALKPANISSVSSRPLRGPDQSHRGYYSCLA